MKIERVEIHPLSADLAEPFGWSQRWTSTRQTTAVKITADDGTYGWGESGNPMAMEALAAQLLGEDPTRTEALWQKLFGIIYQSHSFAGPAMDAISAFDMACWDIAGKAAGKPVSELLGGGVRDRIPVYATGLYYLEDDFPEKLSEEALGYKAAGFKGMKLKVGGKAVDEDVRRVRHLREILGPEIHLMMDANEGYDVKTAIYVGQALAEANLSWFEEPVASYDDKGNLEVRRNVPMPISGGESLKTRHEFAGRLANRVFDIIQPDIAHAGGISEMHKIGHMANAFGVSFNPHFWGTGISLAATLHVAACLPSNPPSVAPQPYVNQSVMEFDRTPHPIRENLTDPIFDQENSEIAVPTAPGLGVDVIEDQIERFAVDGSKVVVWHA
ncbi:MAG: mandelate racemase/muconate lactonizing enzyme family protein [Chloroflexi bacterium]|nr:mandelate racemase/muconate lactonizing enzyme family protein [Chloroflexota bacterium]